MFATAAAEARVRVWSAIASLACKPGGAQSDELTAGRVDSSMMRSLTPAAGHITDTENNYDDDNDEYDYDDYDDDDDEDYDDYNHEMMMMTIMMITMKMITMILFLELFLRMSSNGLVNYPTLISFPLNMHIQRFANPVSAYLFES